MTLLHTAHTPSLNPWREFELLLGATPEGAAWTPAFDVTETDTAFVLHGDLPGLTQKDIEVRIEDDVLTVSGERKALRSEDEQQALRLRRPVGVFRRRFTLPDTVNSEAVQASYTNGVLELVLPKQEPVDRSRIITVS